MEPNRYCIPRIQSRLSIESRAYSKQYFTLVTFVSNIYSLEYSRNDHICIFTATLTLAYMFIHKVQISYFLSRNKLVKIV